MGLTVQQQLFHVTAQLVDRPVGEASGYLRRLIEWLSSWVSNPVPTSGRYLEQKLITCQRAYKAHAADREERFQEVCQAFKVRLNHLAPHLQGQWKVEQAMLRALFAWQGERLASPEVTKGVEKIFYRPLQEKVGLVALFGLNAAISQLMINPALLSYVPSWANTPLFMGAMMLQGNILGTLSSNQDWAVLRGLSFCQTAFFVNNAAKMSHKIYLGMEAGKPFLQHSFQEFMTLHFFLGGSCSLLSSVVGSVTKVRALSRLHPLARRIQGLVGGIQGLVGTSQMLTMLGCMGRGVHSWWTTQRPGPIIEPQCGLDPIINPQCSLDPNMSHKSEDPSPIF